ncbi:hypothetical protein ACFLZE_01760 [Thermodesulfobacteriota bacterium]
MDEKHRYITARIKTQKQIEKVYPSAKYWGGPRSPNYLCRSACESLLPYLELAIENGFDNFDWISKDTDWDIIRSTNEFKMLIDKHKK